VNRERLIVSHAAVVGSDSILDDYSVVCEDGRIVDLFPSSALRAEGRVVDAEGRYLVPGFIDLHIHGFMGKLFDNGADDLAAICREIPRHGVTALLPAVTPGVNECRVLSELAEAKTCGAEILGFFLEGHFLKLTGAIRGMIPDYTNARVQALKKALAGRMGVFGISPEIPDILSLLPLMCEGGVPAFITHTKAGYDETIKAIEAGARHATHFYDVFPYPGEQEGGVRGCGAVEAIMSRPEATVDFILDGEHVHPGAVKMALACKGADKVCLITDANLNAGMEPGVYKGISGTDIVMKYPGGPAREYNGEGKEAGGLTGSGLTLDLAFANAVKLLGLSMPKAAALVSANPAKVLGLENERGKIEKNCRADFSLLNRELKVTECYIAGEIKYISHNSKEQS
jgi:N-acetylglucosamine-6-phosphate deacetylase